MRPAPGVCVVLAAPYSCVHGIGGQGMHEAAVVVGQHLDEGRRDPRKMFEAQVRLGVPGAPPVTLLSHDLGAGGLFVRSQNPLAVGTRVALSFQLPGQGRFACLARVAWRTGAESPSGVRCGMGLCFEPADKGALTPLWRFLDADAGHRRVVILEDDPGLRRSLVECFSKHLVQVAAGGWADREEMLRRPHAVVVVGADRPGLSADLLLGRAARRKVALLGFDGAGVEWHRQSLFCFSKPVDPEKVARFSLALFP